MKGKATGPALISGFEVMALGVGFNALEQGFNTTAATIQAQQTKIWENPAFINSAGTVSSRNE